MKHRLSVHALLATIGACLVGSVAARAGVYVTGSVSTQATTLPYQGVSSDYGSASIDFDLGRYIRLGYTYGVEQSRTSGYTDPNADPASPNDNPNCNGCLPTFNNTTEVDHSVGLTVILYEGSVFMPFLLGGVIDKFVTTEQQTISPNTKQTETFKLPTSSLGPQPYGGGGLGIRLNRDFTLKFSYQVSPGLSAVPGEAPKKVLDARSTVGLTYQML